MNEELIGIAAWNSKLLSVMRNTLWVKMTNTGMVPVTLYQKRLTEALDFLEEFEGIKHRTMMAQLAKHANICKREMDDLQAIPWWKIHKTRRRKSRIQLLWISYSVYANAMSIISSTLPEDFTAEQQQPQDQETPISETSVDESPLTVSRSSDPSDQ